MASPRAHFPRGGATAVAAVATLGTVAVFWLGYRTGEAGGELVYRHGAAGSYVSGAAANDDPNVGSGRRGGDDD